MIQEQRIGSGNVLFGIMIALALLISGFGMVGSAEPEDTRGSGTVSGYVYDNVTEGILYDIEITLYNYETDHSYRDYSDEAGYYEFDNLESGEYRVRSYHEKYYDHDDYISISTDENLQYDIYLDPYECMIFGNIYDSETGEPIENSYIYLDGYSDDGEEYYTSDEPGEDAYYDFFTPPGEYELRAYGEGYMRGVETVDIEVGEEVRIDFYLTPLSSINGSVYDGETHEPITDIWVDLHWYDPGWGWYLYSCDRTNETGFYELYMEEGEYKLYVNIEAYKTFEQEIEVGKDEHIEVNIYLEPDLTRLSGYVYNLSSGEPIEGAEVEADNWDTWDWDYTYTDENGYYELYPGVGEVSVSIYKSGYHSQYDSVTMEEDVPLERDYYLDPYESTIFGTVYDEETSDPISYAYVTVQGEDFYEYDYTNGDGEYSMYLDAGEYTVTVNQEDYFAYETTVTIDPWEDYQLDVYLVPFNCMVFGYVTNEEGEPIEDAYVSISSDNYSDYDYADDEGYYEFECPPSSESGEYTLNVQADNYRIHREQFWLEPGEELQIDVEMQEQWSAGSIWRWIWELVFG